MTTTGGNSASLRISKLLGSLSIGSHSLVRGSTSSTVGGIDGPSTVRASIDPPALILNSLATMPGKEEIFAKLLFLINAPAQRLATVINATGRDLANLLLASSV